VLPTRHLRASASEAVRDPVFWTSAIQFAKTVVAAVVAWVVAAQALGLPQAFLAPWSALLVVHATVYRTFSRGAQQVGATVAAVMLSWAVGHALGVSTVGVTILLVLGLMVGNLPWLKAESTSVAATGMIVLTTGYSTQDAMLVDRLLATVTGIVVGLLVNLLVWPPLRDYSASRAIDAIDDAIGELLCDMADRLRGSGDEDQDGQDGGDGDAVDGWIDRTRGLDEDLDRAWALWRQAKESSRLNPRRAARGLRKADTLETVLRDDEQAVAEVRSMARTLRHSVDATHEWDPRFRARWLGLLAEAGSAIAAPDAARVRAVRLELRALAENLSDGDLPALHWPEYGALIMNLRNIVTSMDRVAEQNPIEVPRYVRRGRLLRHRAGRVG